MKKSTSLFIFAIILLLSGCNSTGLNIPGISNSNKPKTTIKTLNMKTTSKIVEAKKIFTLDNGGVILPDGVKVLDEEGDIINVYTINNNNFYVVKTNSSFKIKNLKTKELLKEFKKCTLHSFQNKNKVLFAVKYNKNTSIYENIYLFNGKTFSLVNKNLNIPNGSRSSGAYALKTYYSKVKGSSWGYSFRGYELTNIEKGHNFNIMPLYPEMVIFGTKASDKKFILGTINDNIFYLYRTVNEDYAIELYNDNTKVQKTILLTNKKLQFLKYNNQIVMKIFNNPKLKNERDIGSSAINITSKYTNEPATYISLNSLEIVKGVSKDFKTIIVNGNYATTLETLITYDLEKLYYTLGHYEESATLKEIFKNYHSSQSYNGRVF